MILKKARDVCTGKTCEGVRERQVRAFMKDNWIKSLVLEKPTVLIQVIVTVSNY